MAKKNKSEFLNEEQEASLQKMVNDMLDLAANVIDEYKNIEGSSDLDLDDITDLVALSGSVTQIHHDSPYLDEIFKGDSWKKVIKNIPVVPETPKEDNDTK